MEGTAKKLQGGVTNSGVGDDPTKVIVPRREVSYRNLRFERKTI